jgi:hypothetical protein
MGLNLADFNDGHTCVRLTFGVAHWCFHCEAAEGGRASVLHSMLYWVGNLKVFVFNFAD